MKCVHCYNDRKGRNYDFFYGHKTSSNSQTSWSGTKIRGMTTITNYKIEGRSGAFVCNVCVWGERRKVLLYYALPALAWFSLFFIPNVIVVAVAFLTFFPLIYYYFWVGKARNLMSREVGNKMGIESLKREYKWEGYVLFTPREYHRLR